MLPLKGINNELPDNGGPNKFISLILTSCFLLKGYKAALKEAMKTLSKDGEDEFASKQQKRIKKEEFIHKFLSGIGERK